MINATHIWIKSFVQSLVHIFSWLLFWLKVRLVKSRILWTMYILYHVVNEKSMNQKRDSHINKYIVKWSYLSKWFRPLWNQRPKREIEWKHKILTTIIWILMSVCVSVWVFYSSCWSNVSEQHVKHVHLH